MTQEQAERVIRAGLTVGAAIVGFLAGVIVFSLPVYYLVDGDKNRTALVSMALTPLTIALAIYYGRKIIE